MKILPVNNNNPKFGAKLPKKEINTVIDSALNRDKQAGIPKLYTLLERLDKMPGNKAELTSLFVNSQSQLIGYGARRDNTCQLRIDDQLVGEGTNIYDVLYSATTSAKTQDGKKISMPQSVFDLMWWENREKTSHDLEQFFRE
jgi:hypothetical protein